MSKKQGNRLDMSVKEIILSQEVQYLGGYDTIIIFPTGEVIITEMSRRLSSLTPPNQKS